MQRSKTQVPNNIVLFSPPRVARKSVILGIDPGKNGGFGIYTGKKAICFKMPETEGDIRDLVFDIKEAFDIRMCFMEKVHAIPVKDPKYAGMSSSNSFKFGDNYGFLKGLLHGLRIRHTMVQPASWQRALQCLSGGDKKITKSRAQQLFPDIKITHHTADALLISYFGHKFMEAPLASSAKGRKVKPHEET